MITNPSVCVQIAFAGVPLAWGRCRWIVGYADLVGCNDAPLHAREVLWYLGIIGVINKMLLTIQKL